MICVFVYVNLKLNEIFTEILEVSEVKDKLVRETVNFGTDGDYTPQIRTL